MNEPTASVCVLADPCELAVSHPVWGTGGWIPPGERRALDWLTLCRLMGFGVDLIAVDDFRGPRVGPDIRWLVVACHRTQITNEVVSELCVAMESRSLLLVCQATDADHPLAEGLGVHVVPDTMSGRRMECCGGLSLECIKPLTLPCMQGNGARPVAWLDDRPIAVEKPIGRGKAVVTAFDPSELRDHDGAGGALLMKLFSASAPHAHATLHWHGVLIPRMDDPGSSEALHHDIYDHACLGRSQWMEIAKLLRERHARMSVGYVSGWVDSGEDMQGRLWVDGHESVRRAGNIHPSPLVCFERHAEGVVTRHDHCGEHEALQDLRREGLLEVELHGHTHIFPDRAAWLAAPDRFSNKSWFREFGEGAADYLDKQPKLPHPVDEALAAFREYFDRMPSTLICPGEIFTQRVLVKALQRGLMQVSSYYLAFRHRDRLCWTQHVCAPYLDQPDSGWFTAGLPVVGCFHDFDIARHGVKWLADCLDGWITAGCRRIIGLDDLNALLQLRMELMETPRGWRIELRGDPAWPLPKRFEMMLHFPEKNIPKSIHLSIDGMDEGECDVLPFSDTAGLLEITR